MGDNHLREIVQLVTHTITNSHGIVLIDANSEELLSALIRHEGDGAGKGPSVLALREFSCGFSVAWVPGCTSGVRRDAARAAAFLSVLGTSVCGVEVAMAGAGSALPSDAGPAVVLGSGLSFMPRGLGGNQNVVAVALVGSRITAISAFWARSSVALLSLPACPRTLAIRRSVAALI